MALDGEGVGVVQCLNLNSCSAFHSVFALFECQLVRDNSISSESPRLSTLPALLPKSQKGVFFHKLHEILKYSKLIKICSLE